MLKKIKFYSIAAVTALFIIGCGGGDSGEKGSLQMISKSTKAVKIDDLRELTADTDFERVKTSNLRSSVESFEKDQNDELNGDKICQTGSMDISTQKNRQKIVFDANNCYDGYTTIDGSAEIEIYTGESGGFAEVLSDLSIKDDYFSLIIKKGSNIKLAVKNDEIKLSADFDTVVNDEIVSARDLLIIASESENGGSFYIASGEMSIGEYYFKVDPSFDPAETPIVIGKDGSVGGSIHLLDGAGHKIEISATSSGEMVVKVDENGDGTFSENETLTQKFDTAI